MLRNCYEFNPYAAGGVIWPIQNDVKTLKMTETLAYGCSYENTRWELSNEYHHDRV